MFINRSIYVVDLNLQNLTIKPVKEKEQVWQSYRCDHSTHSDWLFQRHYAFCWEWTTDDVSLDPPTFLRKPFTETGTITNFSQRLCLWLALSWEKKKSENNVSFSGDITDVFTCNSFSKIKDSNSSSQWLLVDNMHKLTQNSSSVTSFNRIKGEAQKYFVTYIHISIQRDSNMTPYDKNLRVT